MARLFGVHPAVIVRDYPAHGLPKEPNGLYDAARCVQWRVKHEHRRAEKALGEFEAEKIGKVRADKRLTQLKTAILRRRFIRHEEAEEALARQANEFRTALEALPRRWAEKVRPSDPAEGEAIIEEMIRAIYQRIAKT